MERTERQVALLNSELKYKDALVKGSIALGSLLVLLVVILYWGGVIQYRQNQMFRLRLDETAGIYQDRMKDMREDMDKEVNLRDKVVEMERLLEDFSGDKDLNEFELYFKRMGAEFWEKLDSRFPGLQPHDKRLCAFIYLRLGTKEIAAITHRAVRSVYTAKNRLKKKMGLAQDADLQDFLHSL